MQYATLFAVMGTVIIWLMYKNFVLNNKFNAVIVLLDMLIEEDVKIVKKENGFDLIVKGE